MPATPIIPGVETLYSITCSPSISNTGSISATSDHWVIDYYNPSVITNTNNHGWVVRYIGYDIVSPITSENTGILVLHLGITPPANFYAAEYDALLQSNTYQGSNTPTNWHQFNFRYYDNHSRPTVALVAGDTGSYSVWQIYAQTGLYALNPSDLALYQASLQSGGGSTTPPPNQPAPPSNITSPTDSSLYAYSLTFEEISAITAVSSPQALESIPRSRTTMKRRPLSTRSSANTTSDIILIIGCALDGPSNILVEPTDMKQAAALYGPIAYSPLYPSPDGDASLLGTWSGNTLVKSLYEMGGGRNVRLLRVGGVLARGADLAPGVHLTALYPGAGYNGATVTLTSNPTNIVFTVVPPLGKGRSYTLQIPVGRTFQQITNIFNADPRNQAFVLSLNTDINYLTAQNIPLGVTTSTLTGGQYGTEFDLYTTPSLLRDALLIDNGPFDIIQDIPLDMLYVAGIYADDDLGSSGQSFIEDLGVLCSEKNKQGMPMLATIGLRPLVDISQKNVNARAQSLLTPSQNYDSNGQVNVAQFLINGLTDVTGIDIGRFISLCAGPDVQYYVPEFGPYVENPAAWYAGLVCSNRPHIRTTNKAVPDTMSPIWRFSHRHLQLLNGGVGFTGESSEALSATQGGGAYVALKPRPYGQGWCVVEDVTLAPRNSAFAHIYVSRILQAVEEIIQNIVSPYIGQANTSGTITALDRQLESSLDAFADTGTLQGHKDSGYGYNLMSTILGNQIGTLYLNLWLLPIGEIHRFDTMITVSG